MYLCIEDDWTRYRERGIEKDCCKVLKVGSAILEMRVTKSPQTSVVDKNFA